MESKIVLFITLLAYSIVVAQSFSYIISLTSVQSNLDANEYIRFRHLTDKNFRKKFKYVFYITLISTTVLSIVAASKPTSLLFTCSIVAWIAFIADTTFMLKGNMPINDKINEWTIENYPPDWKQYRTNWLKVFMNRQIANITGFVSLVIAAVFG